MSVLLHIDFHGSTLNSVPCSRGSSKHPLMNPSNQNTAPPARRDLLVPNPKLSLREQVREVISFKHYSVRTEEALLGLDSAVFGVLPALPNPSPPAPLHSPRSLTRPSATLSRPTGEGPSDGR